MRIGGFLILWIALVGCGKSPDSGPKSVADARAYAELPGLRRSPHQGLQAELVRLTDEQLTPLHLAADRKLPPATTMVAVRPDQLSVQASLREAYPALSRGMHQGLVERIDANADWRIGPVERELLRDFLGRTEGNRQKFRAALAQAEHGLGIDPAEGPLAKLDFFEPLELGCRVEGLAAVHHLADGDGPAALQSLAIVLQAAELLAREQHVPCRLLAANTRAQGLRLLQVLVLHERCDAALLQAAARLLDDALRRWPSDAQAWIGERASALLTYELVRDGHYLSFVDRGEMERLKQQHLLKTTVRAVMGGIDDDQFFYLQAARRMIDGCEQPFCERAKLLATIRQELAARESTQRYPIVAAMLLADFEQAHQRQAEDFVRCVAWHAALQVALGQRDVADLPPSALTGQPFVVDVTAERVRLSGVLLESDEPIEVPVRAPAQP